MTTQTNQPAYGERPAWSPGRPHIRPLRVVLAWIVSGASLLVAAWIVPDASVKGFGGALSAAAVIAILNALLPPVVAALRLPFMALLGFLLVVVLDAFMLLAADSLTDGDLTIGSFWAALGVAIVASAVGVVIHVVLGTNDDDTYALRVIQRIARRSGGRTVTDAPGIVFLEIDGLALPVLRRAMRDGNVPNMARWLADGTPPSRRMGDRPVVADRREPGGHPARVERRHPRVSLGREGDGDAHGLLGTRRLRGDRAAPPRGSRAARRRRRESRQPPLRRGRPRDPHREPRGGGEARESRLPRVLRERVQRHPRARAVRVGGDPRMDGRRTCEASRRSSPRTPRRDLPAPACRVVRRRARPHRLRRAHRHDEGQACGLRDLLELRRGGSPFGPGARRHAGGAAQARRAVRAHRARSPVRGAAVRDRRSLRPRADAGSDVQAAQRLRPRRSGPALGRGRERLGRCTPATRTTRRSGTRSARQPVEAPSRSAPSTTSATRTSSSWDRETSGSST